jgi:hypothetical protein
MKYAKPEVIVLDHAAIAIQTGHPKIGMNPDGGETFVTAAAYEADE